MPGNALEDFLVSIAFKKDSESERVIKESTREGMIQAELISKAIETTINTLAELFRKSADRLDDLFFQAERARTTVSNLEALGYAAAQAGGSVGDMQAAAIKFSNKLRESPQWGVIIKDLLGVNVNDQESMDKQGGAFYAVLTKIASLPNDLQRISLGKILGITIEQIDEARRPEFATRHREDMERRQRMGLDDPGIVEGARKYREAWRSIGSILDGIIIKVESGFMQRFGDVLEHFGNYLMANGDQIANFLARIMAGIIRLVEAGIKWFGQIDEFVQRSGGWEKALKGFAAAFVISQLGGASTIGSLIWGVVGALTALSGASVPQWLQHLFAMGATRAGAALGSFGIGSAQAAYEPGTGAGVATGGGGAGGGGATPSTPGTGGSGTDFAKAGVTNIPYGQGTPEHLGFGAGRHPDLEHVDNRLREIVDAAAKHLPEGYRAVVNEGYNPGGHVAASQHHAFGKGAIDIQILDPQGNALSNRGSDPSGMYHRYAQAAYGEMLARHPELKGQFAWGGAFGTGAGGPQDLMHFDIGGERGRYAENLLSRMGALPQIPKFATNNAFSSTPLGSYDAQGGNTTVTAHTEIHGKKGETHTHQIGKKDRIDAADIYHRSHDFQGAVQ